MTFRYISAADILDGTVSQGSIEGKAVFLGASASGLSDFRATPVDPVMPGVEVHANLVDNLIQGDMMIRPSWTVGGELAALVFLGFMISALVAWSGPLVSMMGSLAAVLSCLGVSQYLLRESHMVTFPASIVVLVMAILFLSSIVKYWQQFRLARRRAREFALSQEGTIEGFAAMAEYRDPETGGHIQRTRGYVRALAEHVKRHPKYQKQLRGEIIDLIYKSAPLHDIGKVGIPDNVLLKPGFLDDKEFAIMQRHPEYGHSAIKAVEQKVGETPFLRMAREIILAHHEKWDGSGYPQGLSGEDIPLPARFMALADVYDALISERVYKPAFSHRKAMGVIEQGAGKHFDPELAKAFKEIEKNLLEIALKYADSDEQREVLVSEEGGDVDGSEDEERIKARTGKTLPFDGRE